jgi:hypothetical protein
MAYTHGSGKIVVAGDVTMDWNLARTRRADNGRLAWTAEDCTCAYWQGGGAALLGDLIAAVADALRQGGHATYEVRQMAACSEPVLPGDPRYHHSYAMWSLFPYGVGSLLEREKRAWRVAEFLGLNRCRHQGLPEATDAPRVMDDTAAADLVVLDDADLGFREQPEHWPTALTNGHATWILMKMARPIAQGALWDYVHQHCAERSIVVIPVNDLRLSEVQISRELSWERTAQDIVWELVYNPRLNALSQCAHVVISFETAGAMLLSRTQPAAAAGGGALTSRLFFDPTGIEGMWQQGHPGGMIGYTSCLTAGIARQLLLAPATPDISQGIQSGLAAMRTLHLEGYGVRGTEAPQAQLAFPTRTIAAALAAPATGFAEAEIPVPPLASASARRTDESPSGVWTILEDRYPEALEQVAQRIVVEGVEAALQGVPLGVFGRLLTVDRQEIEGFRSLRTLVGEYGRQRHPKRPLCIAVFGAPGSGKSFAITEVAASLLPEQIQKLEFNLSQYTASDDLLDALHQVRDVGLAGKIPLVFWDEFDAPLAGMPLGWLRYFLAPMQDGRFQEAQIVHPLGRCIFVFAGGTSPTMEAFGQGLAPESFCAAKGPDFVSRLQGYVNILGPNRQAPTDGYYLIRRAILLRAILRRDAPQLFQPQAGRQVLNIDTGVLRAFLQTRQYKHGVRSMEAIMAMSLLSGKSRFERSCLPAEAQLTLHVDGQDFLALVQQIELTGDLLERLAVAAHEVFCDDLRARGYRWGPQTDEAHKTHSALRPYAELPEEEKEQNRGTVRDMPYKLARRGYVMRPARGGEPPFAFPDADLEELAAQEHERWMRAKLQAGWRWAAQTDKHNRCHRDLVPWHTLSEAERARRYTPAEAIGPGELPETEKDKDRALVRAIPRLLAEAGYTIARVKEPVTERLGVADARQPWSSSV